MVQRIRVAALECVCRIAANNDSQVAFKGLTGELAAAAGRLLVSPRESAACREAAQLVRHRAGWSTAGILERACLSLLQRLQTAVRSLLEHRTLPSADSALPCPCHAGSGGPRNFRPASTLRVPSGAAL